MAGYTRYSTSDRDVQVVAIVQVDPTGGTAGGLTRQGVTLEIDINHHVGAVELTPARGEQWYVERYQSTWRLLNRIPFNDPKLLTEPVEGQVRIGSTGPLELNGSYVDSRAPLVLSPASLAAADVPEGGLMYDVSQGRPVYSDGQTWRYLAGDGGSGSGGYQKPLGGIPAADMTAAVQTSLGKADTAYQKPSGGVPATDLASGVQASLSKADSAYQKPVGGVSINDLSSAIQTSLNKAETAIQSIPDGSLTMAKMQASGTPSGSTFLRGDGTWVTPTVGVVTDGSITPAKLSATGSASSTTFLRGDNTWATPTVGTVGDGQIGTAKLADAAVTTAKLADGAGTLAKLSASVQASLAKADSALQSVPAMTAANIVDATSLGRSLLTALDAPTARTALSAVGGSSNGTPAALTLWVGTAAQYAAIGTKSATTVYITV